MHSLSTAPRRAWQRRSLGRKRSAVSPPRPIAGSQSKSAKRVLLSPRWDSRLGSESENSNSSFVIELDSGSECSEVRGARRSDPTPPVTSKHLGPRGKPHSTDTPIEGVEYSILSESDVDSGPDSGYQSLEDDPDDKAYYYDELLQQFQADGPALANHGENTERMEKEQEQKWNT